MHFPWKMPGDELCGPGCDPVALWEGLPRLAKTQIILVLGWFEYYGEAKLRREFYVALNTLYGVNMDDFLPTFLDLSGANVL